MSYQAFYRKWRPKSFDGVFGQKFITETFKKEVAGNKLSHAYLFCGSRGTGKTTCAKILAKAVNCEHPINGNPCQECAACRAIEQEAALDVVEMDAASNTGVDDIRILRESAAYTPASCKYRVFIIDEVHMLSKSAFNALLKTLEEPPAHVIFILATTDPEAIPVTVLSRCQRFDFKRLSIQEIMACLKTVCEKESVSLSEDAARLIARLADGGMRDALSILDQCAGVSSEVDEEIVAKVARSVSHEPLKKLALALAERQTATCIAILDELYRDSRNLLHVTRELMNTYRQAMLAQADPTEAVLKELLEEEKQTARAVAHTLTQNEVFTILTELQNCYVQQTHAENQKLELEIALIRLTDPRQQTDLDRLLSRLERLEQAFANPSAVVLAKAEPAKEEKQPEKATEAAEQPEVKEVEPSQSEPEEPIAGILSSAELAEELGRYSKMLAPMVEDITFTCQGNFLLARSPEPGFAEGILMQEDNRKMVEQAAKTLLGHEVSLKFEKAEQQAAVGQKRLAQCLNMAKTAGIDVEKE